jgi:predicted transcriptional regulator YdeE
MEPEIVERKRLLLAGVTDCGKDVTEIDIRALWEIYDKAQPGIENRVDGTWHELHVGSDMGGGIYTVIAGAEISELGELPVGTSLKVVPAGRYAHFVHRMRDGGFDVAFANVEAWVKESGTETKDFGLQVYGADFDPGKEDSTFHIYIPLVDRTS